MGEQCNSFCEEFGENISWHLIVKFHYNMSIHYSVLPPLGLCTIICGLIQYQDEVFPVQKMSL